MVANGEFPVEWVSDYIAQRNSLAMFVSYAPKTRETLVNFILDLTRQLTELECAD